MISTITITHELQIDPMLAQRRGPADSTDPQDYEPLRADEVRDKLLVASPSVGSDVAIEVREEGARYRARLTGTAMDGTPALETLALDLARTADALATSGLETYARKRIDAPTLAATINRRHVQYAVHRVPVTIAHAGDRTIETVVPPTLLAERNGEAALRRALKRAGASTAMTWDGDDRKVTVRTPTHRPFHHAPDPFDRAVEVLGEELAAAPSSAQLERRLAWTMGLTATALAAQQMLAWTVPTEGWSLALFAALAVATVVVAARSARTVARRRLGAGLACSLFGVVHLFGLLFALLAVIDDTRFFDLQTPVGVAPKLGEWFFASVGVAVSEGTNDLHLGALARALAHLELLLLFGGAAAVVGVGVRRLLTTRRDVRWDGPPAHGDDLR